MFLDQVAKLIANLDVSGMYDAIGQVAKIVSLTITPAFLIIAIYMRSLETHLGSFSSDSKGRWTRAVRDIVVFTTVCAVYFSACQLIINFSNDIYKFSDNIGSLSSVMDDMDSAVKDRVAKSNKQTITEQILTALTTGGGLLTIFTGFFYYFSLMVVAFLSAFMKIAHTLVFGVAFIWGLIAIPLSVSQGIKLLRGWAILSGVALLWPLIQGLLIAMIRPVFVTGLNSLVTSDTNVGVDMMSTEFLFTMLNFIIGATIISAPFLTNALVSNAGAAQAIVAPFIAAALTAATGAAQTVASTGGAVTGEARKTLTNIRDAIQGRTPTLNSQQSNSIGNSKKSFNTELKNNQIPPVSPDPAGQGQANTGQQLQMQAGGNQPGGAAKSSLADKKRQQRRGVILNMNKNKPTP